MPTSPGAHSSQIAGVRALLSKKGRREQGRFTFEGPTLLAEAIASGVAVQAVYATRAAQEAHHVGDLCERAAIPIFIVDDRTMARISDVETPSGIVAVAPIVFDDAAALLKAPGVVALLAGVSDPGNAGTLLRSAEAFGLTRVLIAQGSVDPYNPKVVRAAMGSLFRLQPALVSDDSGRLWDGWDVVGLDAAAEPITALEWRERTVIAVGSERHGLGAFAPLCTRKAAIPMRGRAESLNAAVAGSLAFYEAAKHSNPVPPPGK